MNPNSKLLLAAAAAFASIWAAGAAIAADPVAKAPAGTQPATQPTIDAHWRDVLDRLGSTAFAEREAAQKELAALTYKQMELLKQLIAGATDAEVKFRLRARLTEIEEELAYSPPPISLDVQNATLNDVAEALGKAMDMHLETWPPQQMGGQGRPTWTLAVKEKPFWNVIMELQQQRGMGLQDINGQLRLMEGDRGIHAGKVFGGLCVFPQSITRSRTANLQAEPGGQLQPEQMSLSFTALLDPRVAVSNSRAPEVTKVVDDLGNVLHEEPEEAAPVRWNNFGQPTHTWGQSVQLTIPQKPGRKIASVQGRLRLVVQLATEKMEVTEVEKKINTPLNIGSRTVTFQQFEPQPDNNSVRFNMQASAQPRINQPGTELDAANAPVTVAFIDSTGKFIWGQTIQGGSGGSFGGQFVPPLKVVLSAPTKLREVTIPFELKDLPLP